MAYEVCVLRAPGTNCDMETAQSIRSLGIEARVVHIKRFMDGLERFSRYDGLVIPGGFSYGDHIRAGALLGKILRERFGEELDDFTLDDKPILGICNGFQILVECGLLPGDFDSAALGRNTSSKFECRWVHLRREKTDCIFTKGMEKISLPVAHGEGRFFVDEKTLKRIKHRRQIVFNYVMEDGRPCRGEYPWNPNGSIDDIAGICNEKGTTLGLMPHPERAYHIFMHPRWSRERPDSHGDGYRIFKNMVEYIKG